MLMNLVGSLLWLIAGGITMNFWFHFKPNNFYTTSNPAACGIAMGALSLVNAAAHFGDTFLSYRSYAQSVGYQQHQ
jgi:hypothetical protein